MTILQPRPFKKSGSERRNWPDCSTIPGGKPAVPASSLRRRYGTSKAPTVQRDSRLLNPLNVFEPLERLTLSGSHRSEEQASDEAELVRPEQPPLQAGVVLAARNQVCHQTANSGAFAKSLDQQACEAWPEESCLESGGPGEFRS